MAQKVLISPTTEAMDSEVFIIPLWTSVNVCIYADGPDDIDASAFSVAMMDGDTEIGRSAMRGPLVYITAFHGNEEWKVSKAKTETPIGVLLES